MNDFLPTTPPPTTDAQSAHQQEIAALRVAASQQDTRLAQLTHLALALEQELLAARQREEEWTNLRHSPGFALLRLLQRMRAHAAPPQSRRERLLEIAGGWLRILNERGAAGLHAHLRGEARWRWKALVRRIGPRRRYHNETITLTLPPPRPPLTPHQEAVDIVVCVHNALEDVERCLASILRHTTHPYALLLVDDGSDPPTRDFLADFAAQQTHTTLLRSDTATGYTCAANRGLRHSKAPFVVLLNSDTIVTPGWLDRLVACAAAEPSTGIVGPLSNTASYQSIPAISAGSDWAENPLPEGWGIDSWAAEIAARAVRCYPAMPLLNGFCLLIRRAVIDAIGCFDEDAFGAGYGEENDYCLRARAAGWGLALADDAYIYHAQSRSYSHSRRRELSERAARILTERYGRAAIAAAEDALRDGPVLLGIRARAGAMAQRAALVAEGRRRFAGKRLLCLLPVDAPGGGANVVLAEAAALVAMGVDVHLFNLEKNRQLFATAYPDNRLPVHFGSPLQAQTLAENFDGVIATWYESVEWLPADGPTLGYYVQDFEARFFSEESDDYRQAAASYTARPDLRCFTKTEWNQQEVLAHTGVACVVVGPSVDIDRFRPFDNTTNTLRQAQDSTKTPFDRPRTAQRDKKNPSSSAQSPSSAFYSSSHSVRITAMIRPNSPRRSPQLTMQLLRRLSHHYGERVAITLFGVSPADPGFADLPQDFDWQLVGMLETDRVAALLGRTDVFVDFSTWQAMGLTALEAMAAGAAVIVPQKGGATSFARHGENALVVDTSSVEACWRALRSLVEDDHLRTRLRSNAIRDACAFYPERAALNILTVLFDPPADKGASQ